MPRHVWHGMRNFERLKELSRVLLLGPLWEMFEMLHLVNGINSSSGAEMK